MAKFKSCQISMALTHVGITATTFTNSSLVWGQYKFMIKMLKANGNGNMVKLAQAMKDNSDRAFVNFVQIGSKIDFGALVPA